MLQEILNMPNHCFLWVFRGLALPAEVVARNLADNSVEAVWLVAAMYAVHERGEASLLYADAEKFSKAEVLQQPVDVVPLLNDGGHLLKEYPWDVLVVLK